MSITIPIKTIADLKGFKDIEAAAIKATKTQIAEHRRVASLTKRLDADMARERAKGREQLKTGAGAVAMAGGILVGAGAQAIAAARESIASENELQTALNSTGKAAEGYKEQLTGLASALQNTSNFSDEAVQHAESVLLTFDKVGRDIMPRATQAVADLGEMFGGTTEDLQSAAMQIGKALDGNIGALKRSGVSFTESQEEQIKAMFEAGKVAEAQGLIMAQLEKQVSGQAQAARDAAGGTQDLIVSFGELEEAGGKLLLAIGDAGASGALSDFLDKLTEGAQAWESAIKNAQLLEEAQDRVNAKHLEGASAVESNFIALNDFLNILNPMQGALNQGAEILGSYIGNQDKLAESVQEVAAEQAAAKSAAEGNAAALKAEGDAAEDDAKSQEELERALKAANAARRDMVGSMIDITEKAAADTLKVNEDFAKDDAKLLADHAEANTKITADSEKERIANAKQLAKDLADVSESLAKDLAKVDKELAKDKAKLDKDTGKQIARMQQDAAREEKQQRRARLIDARGDERLFQFDMRQLAAEGSFNAISEALERRAIEKEIEGEKLKEEQTAKDESSRIEIDRIRADAEERKREMEAEAQARKEELQVAAQERTDQLNEQAAEEEVRRQEELAQALADEQTSYDERQQALVEARDEKLAAIEEGKQAAIAKLAEELAESGDLTKEEMEALIPVARSLGEDVGSAFAEGMNNAYAKEQQINNMLGGLGANSAGNNNPGGQATPGHGANIGHPGAFAGGGAFTVGGVGGTDSQLVSFWATPGEPVRVGGPALQAGGGSGITINQTINGGGEELARRIAAVTKAAAERELERYHSEVIVPWAGG